MMVSFIFVCLVSMLFTMFTGLFLNMVADIMNYVNETSKRLRFFVLLVFIYWVTWFCLGFEV